jgi:hypothetical protein
MLSARAECILMADRQFVSLSNDSVLAPSIASVAFEL